MNVAHKVWEQCNGKCSYWYPWLSPSTVWDIVEISSETFEETCEITELNYKKQETSAQVIQISVLPIRDKLDINEMSFTFPMGHEMRFPAIYQIILDSLGEWKYEM